MLPENCGFSNLLCLLLAQAAIKIGSVHIDGLYPTVNVTTILIDYTRETVRLVEKMR